MPLVAIPIRTETVIRRTPSVNFALIAANALMFLLFDARFASDGMRAIGHRYLHLVGFEPSIHQFFTYQFIHADFMHLVGNMLFLWVFGNSVNAKMGNHFINYVIRASHGLYVSEFKVLIHRQKRY
jgi:membrane associated rhomboid family serine protease